MNKQTITNYFEFNQSLQDPLNEQAMLFSKDHANRYFEQHIVTTAGLERDHVSFLAAARLEWVLTEARQSLSNKLSFDDVIALMDCFQGELFCTNSLGDIAGSLQDHIGYDDSDGSDDALASGPRGLLERLVRMSAIQKLAVADAIEQAWHSRNIDQEALVAFFDRLGLRLADQGNECLRAGRPVHTARRETLDCKAFAMPRELAVP